MIKIGDYNTLPIAREMEQGYYLSYDLGEVLLPRKYIVPEMKIGDEITVFVYRDSEDRLVATTETPLAKVGDFAYLRIKDINRVGYFLDWGLEKDLFLPHREKRGIMQKNKSYVVKVMLDPITERIIASARISNLLDNHDLDIAEGDTVEAMVYHISDLGYQVIVNKKYQGIIYLNQVHFDLKIGDTVEAVLKKIRPGNKLDIMIMRHFKEERANTEEKILKMLSENDGFLPLNDKTPPELIKEEFGISKKSFKKVIGMLYRQEKIIITDKGIELTDKSLLTISDQ